MAKDKELSIEKKQIIVDLHKLSNTHKIIYTKLIIPLNTIMAIKISVPKKVRAIRFTDFSVRGDQNQAFWSCVPSACFC